MGQYSKSSCPKCKTTLEGWHRSYITFGNPFAKCPSCGIIVRVSHINEWEAMSGFKKLEYCLIFYFQTLLFGGMGVVIFGLIFDEIFDTGIFVVDNNPSVFHVATIIIVAVVVLIWRHKKFQKSIEESKERTKDLKYRQMLGISQKYK